MVGRLSDNVFATSEIHALGRIEFATNYKTVCPITRSREEFENALNYYNGNIERTCMNDAIREAIRQIKTFTDSPRRARRNCKKLIICLSDGINNHGHKTTEILHDWKRRNKIIIDLISFVRDDQLKTEEEVLQARQMRKLCTDSGGYVYQNIQFLSDIELAAMFEQEAAVWLSKRCRTSCGAVDKPERYVPPSFKEMAVHQLPSSNNVQSSSQSRRIFNEFHALLSHPLDDVTIFAVPSDIAFWKVILKGPAETPYERKFWMLFVEFDSNYPKCSPNVRFATPIYHVNISGDGKICHQILGRGWSQQTKMRIVFENILDLLKKPNFDDAVSLEMAHLYNKNNNEYKKQAEIHSKKYAKTDIEILKREYRLEEDNYQ
jgi:ubiquitin-protein ligase